MPIEFCGCSKASSSASCFHMREAVMEWVALAFMWNKKVKVKVPLDNFCPVVFDSRRRCSSLFPSHRASVLSEDNLPWSHGQCDLDTERCYLPTKVVPIYLFAFACFRTARLAGAGTSDGHSLRRMDLILRLLVF